VKKRDDLARCWIDACEVRAFPKVAAMTRQRKVLGNVAPSVLLRENMLDVMREVAVFLPQQAILAAVMGAFPHKSAGDGIHL